MDDHRYRIAHAAAWDAGNAHARKAGRTVWNEDDYNACCAEFARLMPEPEPRWKFRNQDLGELEKNGLDPDPTTLI